MQVDAETPSSMEDVPRRRMPARTSVAAGCVAGAVLLAGYFAFRPEATGPAIAVARAHAAIPLPALPVAPPAHPVAEWSLALPALVLHNVNTAATGAVRLYAGDGSVDESAARRIDRLLIPYEPPNARRRKPQTAAGHPEPRPYNRRLLQLVVKAAAHFDATEVFIISSWRRSRRVGSRHRTGEAIDFTLAGVAPAKLAALLRTYPRVGVGIYTHRRTQYVHLDVRDQSYHWADASPPGHVWREQKMTDAEAAQRDAAYRPEQDLPSPR